MNEDCKRDRVVDGWRGRFAGRQKLLGVETDRAGRALVEPFSQFAWLNPTCSWSATPRPCRQDGRPVPGVAQAAIQQGRYVGQLISDQNQKGRKRKAPVSTYRNKGNMAVVGKNFAILEFGHT